MKDYRGVHVFPDPGGRERVQQHLVGHYRARMTERLPRLSQPPRSSEKPPHFNKFRFEPGIFAGWRESNEDGVYLPGMTTAPGTTNRRGKRLGTLYQANANWTPTANVSVDLDYLFYDIDSAIKSAGGNNSQILVLRSTFCF
ncbi:hypothetical protein PSUM_00095 [Pseudomonas umsongensis]|uniref:Porin n=1 Tax=Pseudomonas umsongensis TaxID=198618 RepID=A0ABX4DYV5_9PSED|nr:hypothetical protein [Pseudomonas umsongensis]OXR34347.1 hypothetical protein PSUM_00095 [Pseudomonas umsongensis]